jgi:DNA helicase-2/ATP-dependent DNA helicase PcrA
MSRLAVLATQTKPGTALEAINNLFGNDNVEEFAVAL